MKNKLIFSLFILVLFISMFGFKVAAQSTCSDGTLLNECSETKPNYCAITEESRKPLLIDNCTECGCPENYECQNDGACIQLVTCKKEGEKVNRNPLLGPTDEECCEGLTEIRVSKSYGICVNCGDGVCKSPEDESNCPEDCESEDMLPDLILTVATEKQNYQIGKETIVFLTDPPNQITENIIPKDNTEIKAPLEFYENLDIDINISIPRYHGYIIQLKEQPVLVKKIEVEEEIEKRKEIAETSGFLITKFYNNWRASNLEKRLTNILERQKKEIITEHNKFKNKVRNILKREPKLMNEFTDVFNGVALDISDSEAKELERLDDIKKVYPNLEVNITLMDSVPLINADDVWELDEDGNNCATSGKDCLTGKDITIAVIDTGIDYTHPDLGGCFGESCKIIGGYDFVNDDNDPMDDHGHGTHCAATAAGNGIVKGVAPDAKLYAYKVLDSQGSGNFDDIIAAIEISVDPNQDDDFSDHIDVISMSLGRSCWPYSEGCGPDDPVNQVVDNVVNSGVVFVIAAGNSGPNYYTIGSPGTARKAITVGASDKSDMIADFSSRGPIVWKDSEGNTKYLIKPDVTAPGVFICAAQWNNWLNDKLCNNDQDHIAISGTSMATPHVAGAAALLLQKNPDWTPDEIKMVLRNEAIDLNYDINTQGYGRIDILSAVQQEYSPPIAIINSLEIDTNSRQIVINGVAQSDYFSSYKLFYGEGYNPDNWNHIYSSNNQITNGELYTWDYDLLIGGEFTVRLDVIDSNEITTTDKMLFYVNDPSFIELANINNVYHKSIAVGDIDNDGNKEIAIASSGDETKLYVFDYNGNILSGFPKEIDFFNSYFGPLVISSPTMVDLNDNEFKEIIISSGKYIYAFDYKGNDITGFPFDVLDFFINQEAETLGCSYYSNDMYMNQNSISDLNGDDYPEILTSADSFRCQLNDSSKIREAGILFAIEKDGSLLNNFPKNLMELSNSAPSLADVNNDNINEIIKSGFLCTDDANNCGISIGGKVDILDSNGNSIQGWPFITPKCEGFINAPVLGDIDNDDYLEVIAGSYYNKDILPPDGIECEIGVSHIFAWKNNGILLNGWPVECPGVHPYLIFVSLADLNNDGRPEIIGLSNTHLCIFNGDGSQFIMPMRISDFPSNRIVQPIIGDIDNDNFPEIIFTSHSNIYLKRWNGENLPGWPRYIHNALGQYLTDLDNDNKLELIIHTSDGMIFKYDFEDQHNNQSLEWPMFQHDQQHTGHYSSKKEQEPKIKSMINNTGIIDVFGYLLMKVQKLEEENWIDTKIVVNDLSTSTLRIIEADSYLALDTLWKDAGAYTTTETGTFRVYAALLSKDSNIMKNMNNENIEDSYEFIVS